MGSNSLYTELAWNGEADGKRDEDIRRNEKRRHTHTQPIRYSFVCSRRVFFLIYVNIVAYPLYAVALLEMNSSRQTVLSNKQKGNYDVCQRLHILYPGIGALLSSKPDDNRWREMVSIGIGIALRHIYITDNYVESSPFFSFFQFNKWQNTASIVCRASMGSIYLFAR